MTIIYDEYYNNKTCKKKPQKENCSERVSTECSIRLSEKKHANKLQAVHS